MTYIVSVWGVKLYALTCKSPRLYDGEYASVYTMPLEYPGFCNDFSTGIF